jgi:GxxExxY protein
MELDSASLVKLQEKQILDPLTGVIIGAAIEVHRSLGPGLLESAYEACLIHELGLKGLKVEVQKPLSVFYKNVTLECGYRLDLVVEDQVIVVSQIGKCAIGNS